MKNPNELKGSNLFCDDALTPAMLGATPEQLQAMKIRKIDDLKMQIIAQNPFGLFVYLDEEVEARRRERRSLGVVQPPDKE